MKPSEIFEGPESSLRKTFDEATRLAPEKLPESSRIKETLSIEERVEAVDFYGWNSQTQLMIQNKILPLINELVEEAYTKGREDGIRDLIGAKR